MSDFHARADHPERELSHLLVRMRMGNLVFVREVTPFQRESIAEVMRYINFVPDFFDPQAPAGDLVNPATYNPRLGYQAEVGCYSAALVCQPGRAEIDLVRACYKDGSTEDIAQ